MPTLSARMSPQAPGSPDAPALPGAPGGAAVPGSTAAAATAAVRAALPPRTTARAFVAAWVIFWLLMITVAVQDHLRHAGAARLWQPLLWELSSCLVASALVGVLWREVPRLDDRLARPLHWLARPLVLLPLAAPLFVAAVYALRHGVYALAGQVYPHPPWPQVLLYESVKFSIFYLLFVAVVFGLRSFAALAAQRLRAEAGVALAREAQLAQLAQQLEPHFLFNALNTVASAIPEDAALAERLLLRLAALLRAATDSARRPQITLGEEIALLQAYAEIMGQRFAGRVAIDWQVDASLAGCAVPALLLQPLLENAFRHGVEQQAGAVRIAVQVQPAGHPADAAAAGARTLRAAVSCSAGQLSGSLQPGVGLANVQRRLALMYGEHAALELVPLPGGGVRAAVQWPDQAAAVEPAAAARPAAAGR